MGKRESFPCYQSEEGGATASSEGAGGGMATPHPSAAPTANAKGTNNKYPR